VSRDASEIVKHAGTITLWVLLSRLTGFARVLVIGAVLGPTFFGNLVQTLLGVPYAICELLAGSLIAAILTPHLARALECGDAARASRIASGFLGLVLPLFVGIAIVGMVLSPWIVPLATAAVANESIRADQANLGWPLLVALLPQVALYPVIGVAIAVQHAHRRFAVPTGAQVVENFVFIVLFAASGMSFGVGREIGEVTVGQSVFIGVGSTIAVVCHAVFQMWAASRLKTRIRPSLTKTDPEVRQIAKMIVPSTALAAINSGLPIALLIVAGGFPGAAIALQIGLYLYNLPVALFARPIAAAQLPTISAHAGGAPTFRLVFEHATRLALFMAIPVSILYVALPTEIAGLVALGAMAHPEAIALIAAAVAGFGFGIVGESALVVAISAAYAIGDTRSPLTTAICRLCLTSAGIAYCSVADHNAAATIWLLAISYSVPAWVGAIYLRHVVAGQANVTSDSGKWWLLSNALIAATAVVPSILICRWFVGPENPVFANLVAFAAAAILSGLVYLFLQWATGSAELRSIFGIRRMMALRSSSGTSGDYTGHTRHDGDA
jgi:putative peptidoglycan lipid II flippase